VLPRFGHHSCTTSSDGAAAQFSTAIGTSPLTALAYSFLQKERRRRGQTHLTLPQVRAVIQEVLTAHLFITRPDYLRWMLELKDVELRI
jgi:hypothetical protein